jgi:RNA methyltransferase, TrmH family
MTAIRSRANPRVKGWARLASEPRERRKRGVALIEGIHVVETFLDRGGVPESLIVEESAMERPEIRRLMERAGIPPFVLSPPVFKQVSDVGTPVGIAAEIRIPDGSFDPGKSEGCLFLDGLQDAGNVGTILRNAAAFAVPDVLLGPRCADPWSPKALRAAMGGHFFLRIAFSADLAQDVSRFGRHTVCTVAHDGIPVGTLDLSGRIGWIFGGEAAGVSQPVAAAASHKGTIPTPGGTESLNVAACAAICLYERHRQLNTRGARS